MEIVIVLVVLGVLVAVGLGLVVTRRRGSTTELEPPAAPPRTQAFVGSSRIRI